jgi:hypothetical protein
MMCFIEDDQVGRRQINFVRSESANVERLDRSDLNSRTRPSRVTRLDDAVIHADVVQLARCLLDQLSAMGNEDDAPAMGYVLGNENSAYDGFTPSGRANDTNSTTTGCDLAFDTCNCIGLIGA